MKKKVILLSLLVLTICTFFVPISQQQTVLIKAPFLNVYRLLADPLNWQRWRPDIKKDFITDSTKFSIQKDTASFTVKNEEKNLGVRMSGNIFTVTDHYERRASNYNYVIFPDKFPKQTFLSVYKDISLFSYLIGKIKPVSFSDTHVFDLKKFMETDSLLYGFKIFKTRVPESFLIEIKKEVLAKNKFDEAAKMFSTLQQFVKAHQIKQVQPLIAQFITKGKDSTQVNIGLYVDKEVKGKNDVNFARMPKGGPLYAIKFNGKFVDRPKAYVALHQYFIDHLYQSAILPFETYLDNKLPASDSDRINIQLNFSTYF